MSDILGRTLLSAVTATNTGTAVDCWLSTRSIQAKVVGTGAVTATVLVEVSNDETVYLTLGTITLSGTTSAADGFAISPSFRTIRASVTAISGTGAAVTAILCG